MGVLELLNILQNVHFIEFFESLYQKTISYNWRWKKTFPFLRPTGDTLRLPMVYFKRWTASFVGYLITLKTYTMVPFLET